MSDITRWWWVRHGPTHEKNFVGWRDVPADLTDHAALSRLADFLPLDALVISSDLIRASATADAIGQNRPRLPHAQKFREMNFGDWDGKPFGQIAKEHPELSRAFWETPGSHRPPNGESWDDTTKRVSTQVDEMIQTHKGRDIIAVAHIGVILSQVQRALGQTAQQVMGQKIDNLSVTCLTFDGDWSAELINHCP